MSDITTLSPQQVINYQPIARPRLSIETMARRQRPDLEITVYIIQNWDNKGNQQQYVKQIDGSWLDCYNEVYVTEKFVMERIADYERNR